MLEKAHIAAVVRELKKLGVLHSQAMTFGSKNMNGTPDRYFDGNKQDLWIEFKRLTTMPRSGIAIGDYSDLQIEWLQRRWNTGRNAWGIVGLPNKTVVIQTYPATWGLGTPIAEAVSHKAAALIIWEYCNGSALNSKSKSTKSGRDSGRRTEVPGARRQDPSATDAPRRDGIVAIRKSVQHVKKASSKKSKS